MKKNRGWNRVCVSWVLVAASFVAADIFAEVVNPKISMDAKYKMKKEKPVKIDDEVETKRSRVATTGVTKTEVCTVTVTLKNAGDQPVTGEMVWGFVSDHSSGKGRPGDQYSPEDPEQALFSPGKKSITLSAGSNVVESIISAPFVLSEKTVETENYTGNANTTTKDSEIGDVYKGYLILFTVNGEVVAKTASTASYAKDEWIALCKTPPKKNPPPKKEAVSKPRKIQ
jgi:hypothetical protein